MCLILSYVNFEALIVNTDNIDTGFKSDFRIRNITVR